MNRLFLYAALLLLTQCSKCKDDPQPKNPEDELPAATQTGANTFGCLVNGQAWTPKGRVGTTPNFYISYDPTYAGGALNVVAYRFSNSNQNDRQDIGVFSDNTTQTGTYQLIIPGHRGAGFSDWKTGCEYDDSAPSVYCRGKLTLTRLDATVAAGTFDFVLAKPGCDTIKVTQGRFDRKL